MKILIGYLLILNICGLAMMGIDKQKARSGSYRIPERTLFLIAALGGALGSWIGMYLFRHKTRHASFVIGIPALLLLQIGLIFGVSKAASAHATSPKSAAVSELSRIVDADEESIAGFVSNQSLLEANAASGSDSPFSAKAFQAFFQHFQFEVQSAETKGNTANVRVSISNIDMHALAHDVCLSLAYDTIAAASGLSETVSEPHDYHALLLETIESNDYPVTTTEGILHLTKAGSSWTMDTDPETQGTLVSGFTGHLSDPHILSAKEVLSIYLRFFDSLTASEWLEYLEINDLFSLGTDNASDVDLAYATALTDCFDCSITSVLEEDDGASAKAQVDLTSVDLPSIISYYKTDLAAYGSTAESITSDEPELAKISASLLAEAIKDHTSDRTQSVTLTMENDGETWKLLIDDTLTNALLGDISQALEQL